MQLLHAKVRLLVRLKGALLLGGDRLDLLAWYSDDLRCSRVGLMGRIYLAFSHHPEPQALVFSGEHTTTYLPDFYAKCTEQVFSCLEKLHGFSLRTCTEAPIVTFFLDFRLTVTGVVGSCSVSELMGFGMSCKKPIVEGSSSHGLRGFIETRLAEIGVSFLLIITGNIC